LVKIYVDLGNNGTIDDSLVVENQATGIGGPFAPETPFEMKLEQNYPNPFNPISEIGFRIAEADRVTLKVYDILGREVAVLVNEQKAPGSYSVRFDGSGMSSGVYFYRLEASAISGGKSFVATKKLVLLR
jgi:hypothetical protein